jgi:hypothetical protein
MSALSVRDTPCAWGACDGKGNVGGRPGMGTIGQVNRGQSGGG